MNLLFHFFFHAVLPFRCHMFGFVCVAISASIIFNIQPFLILNLQILDRFWGLGKEIRECWQKIGHLRQALQMIYQDTDVRDISHAQSLKIFNSEIILDRVNFSYDGYSSIFQGMSFAISGHHLILKLYDVTDGSILIDHQNIKNVTKESVYQAIAVIPRNRNS